MKRERREEREKRERGQSQTTDTLDFAMYVYVCLTVCTMNRCCFLYGTFMCVCVCTYVSPSVAALCTRLIPHSVYVMF